MKTLTIFLALTFAVMFSSSLYAGWTKVTENKDGNIFYVDFERIRKNDGYIYYWELGDFLKPFVNGYLSSKVYHQGDCKLFRYKSLSRSFYKESMGEGSVDSHSPENPKWVYPPPNSVTETVLQSVCANAK